MASPAQRLKSSSSSGKSALSRSSSSLSGATSPDSSERRKSVLPKEVKEGLARYQQRVLVLDEIFVSEDHYVHDLRALIRVYLRPLRESGILKSDVIFNIFGNIELIESVNGDLLKKLEARVGPKMDSDCAFGDVFIDMAEQLVGAYSMYCGEYYKAIALLEMLTKKDAKLAKFLEQQRTSHADAQELALRDFLIKPVQRICKYPLLFRELFKHTSEDHADWANLKEAQQTLEKVTEVINHRKLELERTERLNEVADKITGFKGKIVVPDRVLIHEGLLLKYNKVMKGQFRYFFLFNDMLIYTVPSGEGPKARYAFKGDIPLDSSLVVRIDDQTLRGVEVKNGFQVTRLDQKRVYTFCAKNKKELKAWVSAVETVVNAHLQVQVEAEKLKVGHTAIEVPEDLRAAGLSRRENALQRTASVKKVISTSEAPQTSDGSDDDDELNPVLLAQAAAFNSGGVPSSDISEVTRSIEILSEKVEQGKNARVRLMQAQEEMAKDLARANSRAKAAEERCEQLTEMVNQQKARIDLLVKMVNKVSMDISAQKETVEKLEKTDATSSFYAGKKKGGSVVKMREIAKESSREELSVGDAEGESANTDGKEKE